MNTTDLLLQQLHAWIEGRLAPEATQRMLQAFVDTPVWFPGTRQTLTDHPGKSLHRLHLSPGPLGGLPVLPVWFADPATADPPNPDAMLHYTAGTLLVFVLTQRFRARLQYQDTECTLLYDDLLNLRTLMLLRRLSTGENLETPPQPDLSPLVPALLRHSREHPGVARAWLALVSSAAGDQAIVMLQGPPDIEPHLQALEDRLDPLLPPGVSLSVIDASGPFNPEIRQAVSRFKPLHDASAGPRWFVQLRHKLLPPSVPVVQLSISAHGAGAA